MSNGGRVIRDSQLNPNPEEQRRRTSEAVAAERARLAASTNPNARVLTPYVREPLMSSDPASAEGVLIAKSELGPSALQYIADAGNYHEVVLTFPDLVPAGTAINIRTGVYAGGGPAAVEGDAADITLPATGVLFEDDGRIQVTLNGQELNRGSGAGDDEAQWMSTQQLRFSMPIFPGNQVTVRAPVDPLPVP